MVLLAFSLQDQIDKYGTYIGIAAFFGLAILTLLYFAQAREVKRLREWAGHAPEKITELEDLIEELRSAPVAAAPAVQQAPAPVQAEPQPAVAATNGTAKLEPAELAALAFARSAGVHEPHLPKPHTAPVATVAEAPPTEVATGTAASEPAQATNGGSAGHPPVPRPATPAARRNEPPLPPLPPRRAAAAANRRPAASPPVREGGGNRAVILTAIIGVLVLGGAVFGITRMIGNDDPAPPPENVVATPGPEEDTAEEEPTATPEPRVTKENALIAVFNTTGVSGLAAGQAELLRQEGYPDDNLSTGDAPEPRPTSTVLYARGARSAAAAVAEVLGITDIKQLADDQMAQGLVESSQKKWNVVAIIGADKQN